MIEAQGINKQMVRFWKQAANGRTSIASFEAW